VGYVCCIGCWARQVHDTGYTADENDGNIFDASYNVTSKLQGPRNVCGLFLVTVPDAVRSQYADGIRPDAMKCEYSLRFPPLVIRFGELRLEDEDVRRNSVPWRRILSKTR
jgi:hypothetical protein